MKIDYLKIRSPYKNLNNVTVDFDENNLMTVIVGRNGSGKSNVLEALVEIFKNLDLGRDAPFSYELKYKIGTGKDEKWIIVDADTQRGTPAKQYIVTSNEVSIPFSKVMRDKDGFSEYLPQHIFAYYSGPSDRLEKHFNEHRTRFYKALLYNMIDLHADIRPLFYAKPSHSQFVLLAFFLSQPKGIERNFLKEHLGIESLDSIHFVLRKPDWHRSKTDMFWGAQGVVRQFIDLIYPHSLAPLRITRVEDSSLTGKKNKNEFLHLFLPDLKSLQESTKSLTPNVFFKMLESTLLSEIISEVRISVNTTYSKTPIIFHELSEGEQQLLTVLGLLKFTGNKDSLILLDEPDTHLNPCWAVEYLHFLENFIPEQETCHLLMVTHHPLSIADLEKEQLQVMKKDKGENISAIQPSEAPRGMGINLLLRSDIFGMKTTLDHHTSKKITRRNFLASKEILTEDEISELDEINNELDSLGFSFNSDDPDYQDFLISKYHLDTMSNDKL